MSWFSTTFFAFVVSQYRVDRLPSGIITGSAQKSSICAKVVKGEIKDIIKKLITDLVKGLINRHHLLDKKFNI